jgi:hypothetical protein
MTNDISETQAITTSEEAAPAKPKLNFGSLRMIGHFTIRYPRQIT